VRFYLDENLPTAIVEAARRLGVDVVCSRDEGRNTASDEEQLRYAASLGRCLVTRDTDFIPIAIRFWASDAAFVGILIVTNSSPDEAIGAIARALADCAARYPGEPPAYLLEYLHPP
jgi:predicted nuclease of predicted toxin-antitoxin system